MGSYPLFKGGKPAQRGGRVSIRFHVEKNFGTRSFGLYLFDERADGTYLAKTVDLVFEKIKDELVFPLPTVCINEMTAMDLIPEMKKALAGFNYLDKPQVEQAEKVQVAMQAHITSLQYVVETILPKKFTSIKELKEHYGKQS